MNYQDWLNSVPAEITGDPLWTMEAYHLALFTADVSWLDVTKLMQDRRTLDLSSQLFRAMGSIGANLSEGFSRGSGRDRARFYEYALGSARESRTWYYTGRHILGDSVTRHRLQLLTQTIRLLLVMIPDQRGAELREEELIYQTGEMGSLSGRAITDSLKELLETVPSP